MRIVYKHIKVGAGVALVAETIQKQVYYIVDSEDHAHQDRSDLSEIEDY